MNQDTAVGMERSDEIRYILEAKSRGLDSRLDVGGERGGSVQMRSWHMLYQMDSLSHPISFLDYNVICPLPIF